MTRLVSAMDLRAESIPPTSTDPPSLPRPEAPMGRRLRSFLFRGGASDGATPRLRSGRPSRRTCCGPALRGRPASPARRRPALRAAGLASDSTPRIPSFGQRARWQDSCVDRRDFCRDWAGGLGGAPQAARVGRFLALHLREPAGGPRPAPRPAPTGALDARPIPRGAPAPGTAQGRSRGAPGRGTARKAGPREGSTRAKTGIPHR